MDDEMIRGVHADGSRKLLSVETVSKSFSGVQAVRFCSFELCQGGVYGLIGPNGSGKSTLVNLLSGVLTPDSGTVRFDDKDVTRWSPDRRARAGLVRTFQTARLWARLSVAENLVAAAPSRGREQLLRTLFTPKVLRAIEAEDRARAQTILQELKLWSLHSSPASSLSGGQARLLEFGRVLMSGASLALLDEPLAGVNPVMADQVLDGIRRLKDAGVTILLIEHDLGVVRRLCETVFAMGVGEIIGTGTLDELSATAEFADAYLGSSVLGTVSRG